MVGVHPTVQPVIVPRYTGTRGLLYFKSTFFNLPSFTPPVRGTVGEVRYSIEIDVGGE